MQNQLSLSADYRPIFVGTLAHLYIK